MRRPQRNNIVPKRKFAVVASRDNGECLFRSLLSATFAGGQPRNPPESVLAAGVAGLKQDIHKRVCASSRLRQVLRDTQDIEPTAGNFGPVGRADLVSASSYCSVRSPLFATSFYGGELELMVAADVLGVTVAVVTEASQTAYVVMSVYGKGPAVVWLRLGGNHYDWLYPKSDIARSFRPPPGSSRASRRRTPKAVALPPPRRRPLAAPAAAPAGAQAPHPQPCPLPAPEAQAQVRAHGVREPLPRGQHVPHEQRPAGAGQAVQGHDRGGQKPARKPGPRRAGQGRSVASNGQGPGGHGYGGPLRLSQHIPANKFHWLLVSAATAAR